MPALQHVNVEAMDPLRFESVLSGRGVRSVALLDRRRRSRAPRSRHLERELDRQRRRRRRDAAAPARILPGAGRRRPMGGHLWESRVLPDHQAHSQSPARVRRRRWSAGRRRACGLRPDPGRQRGRAGRARASGGRRDPPRSPNRRSRAVSAPDGGDGDLALPCRSRQSRTTTPVVHGASCVVTWSRLTDSCSRARDSHGRVCPARGSR